ncbi:MAG: methyltransferase domain-containing protein [Nitrospira sp.]|nr:methyltransferase domain-containing protein [bacterium]MBL7049957.1 methyltransferase domain-containing protein [Nitrospira sp.]
MIKENSLLNKVHQAYSNAAESPGSEHPFPVGREFAESVGYPTELLDCLPTAAVAAFTGVSNLSISAEIPKGSTVIDIGCGAGLDSFIAAKRTGSSGRVIGLDFSSSMIARALRSFEELMNKPDINMGRLEFHNASADNIPLKDNTVDIAMINGIFNLNPDRDTIFNEVFRIIKPGGTAFVSELILIDPLKIDTSCSIDNWFA